MTVAVIEAGNSRYMPQYSSVSYAGVHDAADASSVQSLGIYVGQYYIAAPTEWSVQRGTLEFDLSSIPTGATVTAATLSLYGFEDASDTDFNITIVSGADLTSTIVVADYGDLLNDTTSYGALTTAGLAIEGWNVITVNAAGLAIVQTALSAGLIRFGLRSSRDISNTTPKLNGADAYEQVGFYGYTTTNKKPKLTLTYASGEGQGVLKVKGEYLDYLSRTGATRRVYGLAAPASHIGDPSGGGTQDAEARTAINAILVALENAKIVADA